MDILKKRDLKGLTFLSFFRWIFEVILKICVRSFVFCLFGEIILTSLQILLDNSRRKSLWRRKVIFFWKFKKTKREIIFVPFPCLWNLLWYLSTLKYGALEGSRKKNYAREFIKWKVVFLKINSSLSSLAMKVLFYLPHLLMSCGQKEGPRSKVFCRIFLTVDHQFVFQRKSLWNILFFWSIPLSFSLSFFPTNSSQSLYIGNILSKKLLIINAITQ